MAGEKSNAVFYEKKKEERRKEGARSLNRGLFCIIREVFLSLSLFLFHFTFSFVSEEAGRRWRGSVLCSALFSSALPSPSPARRERKKALSLLLPLI